MAMSWQDIPRDPIADDDELESLYDRAKMQEAHALEGSVSGTDTSQAKSAALHGNKKRPSSFLTEWRNKKLG